MPPDVLTAAIEAADVVVAHAGTGSALMALLAGKRPVLIPRLPERGEHVDGHQVQFANWLEAAGLAFKRDADWVSFEDLEEAAHWRVGVAENPAPIVLD
jgi:UDP-N-acetylglucosamine--N-acetylmuramyl-(pentapeptide) pyrophosphoryl-undecaprenol N-acetylglucosamine transferase